MVTFFNESLKSIYWGEEIGRGEKRHPISNILSKRTENFPCRNGAGPGRLTERGRKAVQELPPLETYLDQPRFIYSMKLHLEKKKVLLCCLC